MKRGFSYSPVAGVLLCCIAHTQPAYRQAGPQRRRTAFAVTPKEQNNFPPLLVFCTYTKANEMIKQLTPYYCPETSADIVLPNDRIVLDETKDWYIIGFPGVDGIEFRMRATETYAEVFAFYPIESRYVKVADSPDELITRWKLDKVIL